MDSLLLIVRWVLAGIIGLFAVLMAIQAWKDRKPELLVNVGVGALILLLVCLTGWLILLRWELLAVAGTALLLAACAVLIGRSRSQSGTLKAIQELSKKTRPEPMTLEEAKERLALGEELTIMAAFHEQRLGRAMTREELVSYVAEQRENLAEYERQQKLEAEQEELKEQKEEEEAAALIKEMQTGPAVERKLSITLRKKLTVTGIKGQTLPLPSGNQDLWLKMKAERTAEESDGFPVIRIEIKNAAGAAVTIRAGLVSLIDLAEVKKAFGWRSRPEDWRQSFCGSVLLEATEGCSDSRSWIEFPVDDGTSKVAFYSKYCALVITLACPDDGGIWCRVHGLSHLDPDDNHENDFKPQPPFCFPLKIEQLLLFESEDEEE